MSVTSDGRDITMPSLFPAGVYLTFAGAGDSPTAGRGQGVPFVVSTTTASTTKVSWSFVDYVYMAGGRCAWDNAVAGDSINLNVTAPASTVTANLTNTGNVNVAGGLITPAAGNTGAYNLGTAIAVPHTAAGNGAWVWVPSTWSTSSTWTADLNVSPYPFTGAGQVVPTPAGYDGNLNWTFDLYTVAVPIANFVQAMQITGTRQADFTVPAIKPQMILPQWVITASIVSSVLRTTPLIVSWSLTIARNSSV